MPVHAKGPQGIVRSLLIMGLFLVFAGLVLSSALTIRYPVGKTHKSEFAVTELSLTHDIKRDRDGRLATTAESGTGTLRNKKPGKGKACPT